ncbi:MAG TPA: acyl-CoA desaturase [Solirubrobacteraceae bacterium]|jgi:stearoyl-CoA desaturase (delta-9 desaturase)|nr:acyl-CoA desaturase [Solirubrobacteraceae bacterium]
MTLGHRIGNVVGVFVPIAGFVAAIVLLWDELVGPLELSLLFVLYVLSGLGITVGFHRMLTHRAFETSRPIKAVFAILGSMAVQGPVISWVADHRKHHAHTDKEGDPHSPHLSKMPGVLGAIGGLWYAHVGWLFAAEGRAERERYARELVEDPMMRFINRGFVVWVATGLAIPFGLGWLIGGDLRSALLGLLWGGLVRIFVLHHATFAINSLCHFLGRRRFDVDDESRNLVWLAPLSFGEAWHHNHHAFPRSAFHGLRRLEAVLDPGGWVIRAMERMGLVWNVVRIAPERQRAKLVAH